MLFFKQMRISITKLFAMYAKSRQRIYYFLNNTPYTAFFDPPTKTTAPF